MATLAPDSFRTWPNRALRAHARFALRLAYALWVLWIATLSAGANATPILTGEEPWIPAEDSRGENKSSSQISQSLLSGESASAWLKGIESSEPPNASVREKFTFDYATHAQSSGSDNRFRLYDDERLKDIFRGISLAFPEHDDRKGRPGNAVRRQAADRGNADDLPFVEAAQHVVREALTDAIEGVTEGLSTRDLEEIRIFLENARAALGFNDGGERLAADYSSSEGASGQGGPGATSSRAGPYNPFDPKSGEPMPGTAARIGEFVWNIVTDPITLGIAGAWLLITMMVSFIGSMKKQPPVHQGAHRHGSGHRSTGRHRSSSREPKPVKAVETSHRTRHHRSGGESKPAETAEVHAHVHRRHRRRK